MNSLLNKCETALAPSLRYTTAPPGSFTSGRLGDGVERSQLEMLIYAPPELGYLFSLSPAAERGVPGQPLLYARCRCPSSKQFVAA